MVHNFQFGFRSKPPTTKIDKVTPSQTASAASSALIHTTTAEPTLAMHSEARTALLMQPATRNNLAPTNPASAAAQALSNTRHAAHSSYNATATTQALTQFDDHSFYAGGRPLTVRDETDVVRTRVDSLDFWGDDVEAVKDPTQRRGVRIEHRSIDEPDAPEDAILVYSSDLLQDWLAATDEDYVTYGEPARVPPSSILVFVEQWLAADANSYVAHSSTTDNVQAIRNKIQQVNRNTTLTPMDSQLILVDCSLGDVTLILPSGPGEVTVKKTDSTDNKVIVMSPTQKFTVLDSARFVSPGTEWFMI